MYNRYTYWAGLSTDNLGTVGPIWLILLTHPFEIKNSAQEWIYQPSKTWVCAGARLLHDAQSTFWLILAKMCFLWDFFLCLDIFSTCRDWKAPTGAHLNQKLKRVHTNEECKKTVWNFLSFEALQPVHNCWCAACLVIRQDGNLFYWSWFQSLSRSTLVTHKLTHSQLMLSMLSKR